MATLHAAPTTADFARVLTFDSGASLGSDSLPEALRVLDLHPEYRNARYTLRGVFRHEGLSLEHAATLEDDGLDTYVYADTTPSGERAFFLAVRRTIEPDVRAGIPHHHSVDWEAVRMAVDLFRSIMRKAQGKAAFRWYKQLDVPLLHRKIQTFDWSGTHLDVASGIITDLILAHPFPNANHRTSIHFARNYLLVCGLRWPQYNLQGRGHARLHRETKDFFVRSKYLLQLHRHHAMVKLAYELGYRTLRVGDDAKAEITEGDWTLNPQDIRSRHLAAAGKMLLDLADDEGRQKLNQPRSKTLRQWIDAARA